MIFKNFCIFICMDWREIKLEDINIRIKPELKKQYKEYCKENNVDMSKHIRDFIESVVKNKDKQCKS